MPKYSEQFLNATKGFETIEAALEDLEACKPEWATGVNKYGDLAVGTQLLTRDGRRMGNARIKEQDGHHWFKVVTDAGNELVLSDQEIHTYFHIGIYFVDELKRN